jgi:glycosyltransferase involved in cell wall biosynthesis
VTVSPAVSVIIPSYNSAQFLAQGLDSVLAQTLPPAEVLVIDDGSTDATRALMESYTRRYPNVVRYVFQENTGQGGARNHGMRLASSEWVAFLDADDWWKPEKLARQMELVKSNPNAVLLYTGLEMRYPDGRIEVRLPTPPSELWPDLRYGNKITPSTVMAKRKVLLEAGGFDTQFRGTEDWELWVRLGPRLPVACVPDALTCYRVSDASISTKIDHMVAQERAVLNKTVMADLKGLSAFVWRRRIESLILFRAATGARFKNDPRELTFLIQSLLRWPSPFFKPKRWEALAVTLKRRIWKSS